MDIFVFYYVLTSTKKLGQKIRPCINKNLLSRGFNVPAKHWKNYLDLVRKLKDEEQGCDIKQSVYWNSPIESGKEI